VKIAAAAALADLKLQLPVLLANRRDRSISRALPCMAKAMAGIAIQSSSGLLGNAARVLGCGPGEIEPTLMAAMQAGVVACRGRQEGQGQRAEE
jgi:hypothetical protein